MKNNLSFVMVLVNFTFFTKVTVAQIQSFNNEDGIVVTNDIAKRNNKIYTCGSLIGNVNIGGIKFQGQEYNTPFLAVTNQNLKSSLIFPITSINGYTSFTHIYVFDDELYLSGVFNGNILINSDSIHSKGVWDGFIIKLNSNDSVVWYKVISSIGNDFSPKLDYYNDVIYSYSITEINDSTHTCIHVLNANDGTLNWKYNLKYTRTQELASFQLKNDTMNVFTFSNQALYLTKISKGGTILNISNYSCSKAYILSNFIYNNKTMWLFNRKSGNLFNLELNILGSNLTTNNLIRSDYFGSGDIISSNDSIIEVVGFFQGKIQIDSIFFEESDTSNSFYLKYNILKNEVISFTLLPYRNISKTVIIDSTIYYISNYTDGENDSLPSIINLTKNNNNFIVFSKKQINKSNALILNKFRLEKSISIFPNLNSGKSFNVCCFQDLEIKEINLLNSLGQEVSIVVSYIDEMYILKPESNLSSGIYYIEIVNKNDELRVFKVIVI